MSGATKPARANWTFLTNHAGVFLDIAEHPEHRIREIATHVGISRRAAQMIVTDLVDAGYVQRTRMGRHNSYAINTEMPLRRHELRTRSVADLLSVIGDPTRGGSVE